MIKTPIVTKKTEFYINGCKAIIRSPRRRYFNKIKTNVPMYPYSLICYLGEIELRYKCSSKEKIKRKLVELIQINTIGRFQSEGLGLVEWRGGHIEENSQTYSIRKYRRVKIRKGLPHKLPEKVIELLRIGLLHDFCHTSKHQSKIYVEPDFIDKEFVSLLRKHHEDSPNDLMAIFQQYDRKAAMITRKIRSPVTSRYNWYAKKNVNFKELANKIAEVTEQGIWKLYNSIYCSKDLGKLTESLEYGHGSLRLHLLMIANLIVEDYQRGRL